MGVLALTSTGKGVGSASISNVASLASVVGIKIRFKVDFIKTGSGFNSSGLLTTDSDGAGTNTKFELECDCNNSSQFRFIFKINGLHQLTGAYSAQSALPATGNYLVVYAGYQSGGSGTTTINLTDDVGTSYYAASDSGSFSSMSTTGSNGMVTVNHSAAYGSQAETYDGVAIYNQLLVGSAQYSAPSSSDTGIVAFWDFEDAGNPSTATDKVGSYVLNLTASQYTWQAGGSWANPTNNTVVIGNAPVTSVTAVGTVTISITNPGVTYTVPSAPVTSACFVGTISTTGVSGALAVGAEYIFGNGTTRNLGQTASSNAGLQALTSLSFKIHFDAQLFGGSSPPSGWGVGKGTNFFDIGNQTAAGTKLNIYAADDGTGLAWRIGYNAVNNPAAGSNYLVTAPLSQAAIAPFLGQQGVNLTLYGWFDATGSGSRGVTLFDPLGNVLTTYSEIGLLGNLPVITGNGLLTIFSNAVVTWPTQVGVYIVDGLAIYRQQLVGAAQYAVPGINDTGIVAMYRLDEGAGATSRDDIGGPSLTLSQTFNGWNSPAGQWLAPAVVAIPAQSVSASANVASQAANPTDTTGYIVVITGVPVTYIVPNAPVTSVTAVQLIGGVSKTVYSPSVSSATALGTPTYSAGFGFSLAVGVSSQTQVAGVTVSVTIPVVITPPATCQYILDMAVAFSTFNTGPNAPSVIANVPQILQRIRADQRAVFTKIADRSRYYYMQSQAVTTTNASSGRVIDMSTFPVPVDRPLQLILQDGRIVSIVDLLDLSAELSPRAYVQGAQLVEVGNDYSPVAGTISGTLLYVQAPSPDINPAGDLTQTISLPTDWVDVLIISLAQFIAMSDTTSVPPGAQPIRQDEIDRLGELLASRLEDILVFMDHYAGVPATRFDIPRPLPGLR